MLYSYQGSEPVGLPFRIRLPDGSTRTDPSTFSETDLMLAGYIKVDDKPIVDDTKVVSWNKESYSWQVRDKTEEEIYQEYLNTVPKTVTLRQAKLALLHYGLLSKVESTIDSIPSPEGDAARIEWTSAKDVDRESPLVVSMASMLNLSERQVCELFIVADSL